MVEINPLYTDDDIRAQLNDALSMEEDLPALALGEFLTPESFKSLQTELDEGWIHDTVPDRYAYSTRKHPAVKSALHAFVTSCFQEPLSCDHLRFGHRDFTLMHDHKEPTPGLLALLFMDELPDDAGGTFVFMKNGEILGSFTPQKNTLLLVYRKQGVHDFVKYVNHRAGRRALRILSA